MPLSESHFDDVPEAVRDAEAAIAGMTEAFLEWAGESLGEAARALARARVEPAQNVAAGRAIFGVAHNLKGQGGSFGYPLVSWIAAQLCEYLREAPEPLAPAAHEVVDAHLAAMGFVLERRLRGDGGALGARLSGKLGQLAELAGASEGR